MGISTQTTYSYVCDQCEREEAQSSMSAAGVTPPGWRRVTPGEFDADLFCSWTCLAAFAAAQAEVPR